MKLRHIQNSAAVSPLDERELMIPQKPMNSPSVTNGMMTPKQGQYMSSMTPKVGTINKKRLCLNTIQVDKIDDTESLMEISIN